MFETHELQSEAGTFRVKIGRNVRAHCHDGKRLWISQGRTVKTLYDYNKTSRKEFTISSITPLTRSKLFNRLTRSGIHNVLPLNDACTLIVTKQRCLIIKDGALVDQFSIPRGNRPLRQGLTVLHERIYFGDYWSNDHRIPANVYCYDIHTKRLDILVTLKYARHIHFVQSSAFDKNAVLIGTGDENKEVAIYSCNTLSGKLTRIGGGDQVWRAVSVIQRPPYLYWGMDGLDVQKDIVRFNMESGELSVLGALDGPAYYSAVDSAGNMFIATTIEVRGTHRCCLYSSRDGIHWYCLAEWEKDKLHTKYFGYGLIEFINGQENSSELYINLIGLLPQPIV